MERKSIVDCASTVRCVTTAESTETVTIPCEDLRETHTQHPQEQTRSKEVDSAMQQARLNMDSPFLAGIASPFAAYTGAL